jgi:hypothetical protein
LQEVDEVDAYLEQTDELDELETDAQDELEGAAQRNLRNP